MRSKDQTYRLKSGGRIDRDRQLTFTFNGRSYQGFEGDTLASALLANGVHLVGRSMKLHRPRGFLSAGVEEPNALLTLGQGGFEEPNVRATVQPLYEGLVARSQNCWPGVNLDVGACLGLVSGLLPAGFYNKTFKWPNWHWYESFIRRSAGLGTLPPADDPDYYVHRNVHCDVLICGAGPAGLTAALTAGQSGARVLLVEREQEVGGSLLWNQCPIDDQTAEEWLAKVSKSLEQQDNVTILNRTTVTAYFDHNVLLIAERLKHVHENSNTPRERLWKVRAKEVILAGGAIEQPLIFPNNDRPGIMLASAVRHYLRRFAVIVGHRVVVVTNNDSAYQTALDLDTAGNTVAAVIDCRAEPSVALVNKLHDRGITHFSNCVLIETSGRKGLKSVRVGQRDDSSNGGAYEVAVLNCDAVAMSGGWQPDVHLFSQAQGKLRYDAKHGAFVPDKVPEHTRIIGFANGKVSLHAALEEGRSAGVRAAAAAGFKANPHNEACTADTSVTSFMVERVNIRHKSERQWVDFQHDVTLQDIDIAVQENYTSVEHLKRYTTTGMSVDQGKTSNVNALFALAKRTGKQMGEVGTTTFRPFYTPLTLGVIAGRRRSDFYAPVQRSPLHSCQENLGAIFWDYGNWRRPAAYPGHHEEPPDAIQREALAVRTSVGIFDGSPLGKIEIRGPDAAEFLNRFYINNVLTIGIGKARYGLMLNENSAVIDDGIVARLGVDQFLVHTTSGNAARIYAWFEEWRQCEWPELDVLLAAVTTQWANITVSGPKARDVLNKIDCDVDLQAERFPHMNIRQGTIDGIPTRIMRASFTGELGYEINVPANYGMALWQLLWEAGQEFDITPYGLESLMVLRTEKGYLHVGADTDVQTSAADLGWDGPIAKKSADFIGKRSLQRPENKLADRLQFVGLAPVDDKNTIATGAHVVNIADTRAPAPSQGYVTSSCFSPNLKRWIALGLVKRGSARLGEAVNLFHNCKVQRATIVKSAFYDPDGTRLHA